MRRERRWTAAFGGLLLAAAAPLILMAFSTAVDRLESGQAEEGRRQLEEALRRSAVACYAVEGAYPADLEHLEDHCGIQIDRDRYTVFYDTFGSNLMPDITVLDNET